MNLVFFPSSRDIISEHSLQKERDYERELIDRIRNILNSSSHKEAQFKLRASAILDEDITE
jgi:hypothetical protein